jgi:hypothetical protein
MAIPPTFIFGSGNKWQKMPKPLKNGRFFNVLRRLRNEQVVGSNPTSGS